MELSSIAVLRAKARKIRGVIFDLDTVLVSTDEYRDRSCARLCREEGFTFVDRECNQPEREADHR